MNYCTKLKLQTKLERLEEELDRYNWLLDHSGTMNTTLLTDKTRCERELKKIKKKLMDEEMEY